MRLVADIGGDQEAGGQTNRQAEDVDSGEDRISTTLRILIFCFILPA